MISCLLVVLSIIDESFGLYLSLGTSETFGIICGEYDVKAYFPVTEHVRENICEDNCHVVIDSCAKKMKNICKIKAMQQTHFHSKLCEERQKYPRRYCKEKLLTNHCTVCRPVTSTRTNLVPRIVKRRTCGIGGPGGPVHDGRKGMLEYMVNLQTL